MNTHLPELQLSEADRQIIDQIAHDLAPRYPEIPTDASPESTALRSQLTQDVHEALGDTAFGADLDLEAKFANPNIPAIVVDTMDDDERKTFTDSEIMLEGRIALIGIAQGLGVISPNAYEEGGNEVGLIIPRPEARWQISSNGSEKVLRPHQEVSQVLSADKSLLERVDLFKSVALHAVRDNPDHPTPSRIVSTTELLAALSEEEREQLREPDFAFNVFDIIKGQAAKAGFGTVEPFIYAPLSETGVIKLDLDDTVGLTGTAQQVMKRLQDLAEDPDLAIDIPITPGKMILVNNSYALHGRGRIAEQATIPGKERLLQRTQIQHKPQDQTN